MGKQQTKGLTDRLRQVCKESGLRAVDVRDALFTLHDEYRVRAFKAEMATIAVLDGWNKGDRVRVKLSTVEGWQDPKMRRRVAAGRSATVVSVIGTESSLRERSYTIQFDVLGREKPFSAQVHYNDVESLPGMTEEELKAGWASRNRLVIVTAENGEPEIGELVSDNCEGGIVALYLENHDMGDDGFRKCRLEQITWAPEES